MEELEKIYNTGWSDWKSFPDPRKGEYLIAPFGSGVYQLRNTKVDKYVFTFSFPYSLTACSSLSPTVPMAGCEKTTVGIVV